MTGAGLLPVAIHKNKLYFLFGRENKYNDTPGWSDFGGGMEKGESVIDTNLREIEEETCGFISREEIITSIKNHGTMTFTMTLNGRKYITTIVKIPYDEKLPKHFNNNHAIIEKYVNPKIIKTNVIFEKDKIEWFQLETIDMNMFRPFYRTMVQKLIRNHKKIIEFARSTDF
jgi:hypothetical protein